MLFSLSLISLAIELTFSVYWNYDSLLLLDDNLYGLDVSGNYVSLMLSES